MREEYNSVLSTLTEADKIGRFGRYRYIGKTQISADYIGRSLLISISAIRLNRRWLFLVTARGRQSDARRDKRIPGNRWGGNCHCTAGLRFCNYCLSLWLLPLTDSSPCGQCRVVSEEGRRRTGPRHVAGHRPWTTILCAGEVFTTSLRSIRSWMLAVPLSYGERQR